MTRRDRRLPRVILGAGALLVLAGWPGGASSQVQKEISREEVCAIVETEQPDPAWVAADARIVMVEFSDFQCGYCPQVRLRDLPKLEERYNPDRQDALSCTATWRCSARPPPWRHRRPRARSSRGSSGSTTTRSSATCRRWRLARRS